MNLVLASSSPYRKQMLQRILPKFETASPDIDESRHKEESFIQLAERLSREKAQAVSRKYPNALIIGSDQVACLDAEQLFKPGNFENCLHQLKKCQGKTAYFHTGLCLYNSRTDTYQSTVETYQTTFRQLSDQQLQNYISQEAAFDCAGGFKMEGLGIALFEKIQGDDPNILVGLPLIKLIDMLKSEGLNIL